MNSKIIKASLIIIVIALAIFAFSQLKYETTTMQTLEEVISSIGETASSTGELVLGEDPDTYNYNTNPGEFEATQYTSFDDPIYGDYAMFCIQPRAQLKYEDSISYSTAKLLVGNYYSNTRHASTSHEGKYTYPVFRPYEDSIDLDLPVAAAYILSEPGGWSEDKQLALWHLRNYSIDEGLILNASKSEFDTRNSIYDQEALDYYYYDKAVRGNGLNPVNQTNTDDVTIEKNDGEYTVGPFNVTYYDERIKSKNVYFAGISDIKVIAYNKNYEELDVDINVKAIILKDTTTQQWGSAVTPEYFEPSEDLKVDETTQVYPASGQDFMIVFDDPNKNISSSQDKVYYISVKVEFKYMLANGKYTKLQGTKYLVKYTHDHTYNNGRGCMTTCYLAEKAQQTVISIGTGAIRSVYVQEVTIAENLEIRNEISIGGYVWEDGVSTKESIADGLNNTSGEVDTPLKNIKVTLYTSDGQIATLESDPYEDGISEEELMHRINPTYTDENGYYLFTGIDPDLQYYVVFEYNGQRYLPTEYLNASSNTQYTSISEMISAGQYGTDAWIHTSKATESSNSTFAGVEISRNALDSRFAEIGSYSNNYTSSNSLGVVGTYNVVYTQLELMGYTLNSDGDYVQTGVQLVDGYTYNSYGLEMETYSEGAISQAIREYIVTNKQFPDDDAMMTIYRNIAGNDQEIWRMLQFIEDCYIQAYSGSAFTETREDYLYIDSSGNEYSTEDETYGEGEYYINLGLWRRQEFDAALSKDVYKATLKINGKTVVYTYNARTQSQDDYWDINLRISDYEAYYGTTYTRELYESDYLFNTDGYEVDGHSGEPLEIYITYKISVRNQSQSILAEIEEVVDYYDSEYTYIEDLSWVMYGETSITDDEYYNAMVAENLSSIANARDVNSSNSSKYGSSTEENIGDYSKIYITGLDGYKLSSGETAYIYLTFQVNKDDSGRVILDDDDMVGKINLAEINGYSTYYRNNTELPNNVTKSSSNIAGLLDVDSKPGNLEASDLEGDNYEYNFEDDTDRAPGLRVIIDEDAIREANGVVWEDERNQVSGNAAVGDGIRQDSEITIAGVNVYLIEILSDGTEYTWQTTQTDSNGLYIFENYIPGDYIIRFSYGDTEATALTTDNGGLNVVSYNGQDFKSTTYQAGISSDYDVNNDNESGTYTYNTSAADNAGANYSDAKDIWSRREEVNNYTTTTANTNHIAEVLASPYVTPTYTDSNNVEVSYDDTQMQALYNELIQNTYMIAETGIINVEIEYDRTTTDATNEYNGYYVFSNVDFGLSERPKAQVEIDKSVANLQVTLANGTILFDINGSANNALWQDHEEYSLDENIEDGKYEDYYSVDHRYAFRDEITDIITGTDQGLIQLTMDQEIMYGATIRVTYAIKVTNVGETDYDTLAFYYQGTAGSDADVTTTTVNQIVDYVENNLQFDSSDSTNAGNGWSVITADALTSSGLVNSNLSDKLAQFNTIITTENIEQELTPGEEASVTLVLSQLITAQNAEDDLTYENMVEIVETSNSVGRRMAYSVVGNQDPTTDPAEVDSNVAERIIILPPFGIGDTIIYAGIALAIGAILVVGIVLIKKKVIKGKNN